MGRNMKRSRKTRGRNVNSSETHGWSHHSINESVCTVEVEESSPASVGGFQPLQPITSFSTCSDLSTSALLPSETSAGVSRDSIICNSTVIEILLHLLCREREPDQAKRERLVKALGQGIQHWNTFLYIPLHSLSGLEDIRNGFLRKFEFLFEEIQSQVYTPKPGFMETPMLYPASGGPLTQLPMINTYNHHILDDRYSREFAEISLLGKGGFGSVVKAKSRLDGHSYAIKIILMNKKDNETNQKILREVQALAQLDHPNIVRYHSSWLQLYTLPCRRRSPGFKSETTRKLPKPKIEKVKIQELSSSSEHQEIEESSGGIVFQDISSHEQKVSVKKKFNLASVVSSTEKKAEIPGFKFYESKNTVALKEEVTDNYCIKMNDTGHSKGSISHHSSSFFQSHNSVSTLMSDHSRSASTNEFSSDIPTRNDKRNVINESSSTSTSSGASSHFKKSLVLHRKHSREAHVALFIQMGLCGDTLANWISQRNAQEVNGSQLDSVNLAVCIGIFQQILEAVQYIHSKNIVHRDLKPSNIFFTEDGKSIKIGDFGLARNLQERSSMDIDSIGETGEDQSVTTLSTFTGNTLGVGTAMYAPPEVRFSGSYGKKSDMYNLGIILLELIQPFRTGSERADSIYKLKKHGYVDPEVVKRWPDVTSWIKQLASEDQAIRPTATKLLELLLLRNSSEGCAKSFKISDKINVISNLQNIEYREFNFINEHEEKCNIYSNLDNLRITLPEDSHTNFSRSDSGNSGIDLQLITSIVNENKEKDKEIKRLKEEKTKLLEKIAQLQEQLNQTSS